MRNLVDDQKGICPAVRWGLATGPCSCHVPLYIGTEGELTKDEAGRRAEALVKYAALVLQGELLLGGELRHGSARELSDRGWGLASRLGSLSARQMLNVLTRAGGTDVIAASADLGRGRVASERDNVAPCRSTYSLTAMAAR